MLGGLSVLAYKILISVRDVLAVGGLPPELSAAIAWMHGNIGSTAAIDRIASSVSVSYTRLYNLFRTHLNTTPLRFFNDTKMQFAARQLKYTAIGIKQIAYDTGFEEVAYFSNQFRRYSGLSPREYRRKQHKSA
jgi:transcriptional regulator GlxA family with amidase domain